MTIAEITHKYKDEALSTVVQIVATQTTTGDRAMLNIPLADILAKLPIEEMEQTMSAFVAPMTNLLPEKRLHWYVLLARDLWHWAGRRYYCRLKRVSAK